MKNLSLYFTSLSCPPRFSLLLFLSMQVLSSLSYNFLLFSSPLPFPFLSVSVLFSPFLSCKFYTIIFLFFFSFFFSFFVFLYSYLPSHCPSRSKLVYTFLYCVRLIVFRFLWSLLIKGRAIMGIKSCLPVLSIGKQWAARPRVYYPFSYPILNFDFTLLFSVYLCKRSLFPFTCK